MRGVDSEEYGVHVMMPCTSNPRPTASNALDPNHICPNAIRDEAKGHGGVTVRVTVRMRVRGVSAREHGAHAMMPCTHAVYLSTLSYVNLNIYVHHGEYM